MWQLIRTTLFRRPILSLFFLTTLLVCTGFLATAYLTAFLTIITLVTGTKSKTRDSISLGQKNIPESGFQYAEFTKNITVGIEGLVGRIDRLFEKQERMEARVRGLIQEIEVMMGDGGALQHALPDSGGAAFPDPLLGSSIHTALTQPLDTLLDKLRSSATSPGFSSNLLEAKTELKAIIKRLDTLTQAINRTGKTGDEIMRYEPDMTEVLKEWKERNEKVMDGFEKIILISEMCLDKEVEGLDMLGSLLDAWKKCIRGGV
ncbi:hypothetical protein L211DRAFT_833788 [Terfezia boudieri ATCC MYA-4762]|uniref:Uncharacterized protein n=1 Tax=Terfezia boudieri ATCC MYA-4762 TaxID=1051890 RepID=A0A3N4LY51_9PEZI|nr:hypothetical protein L211DRAFT_833788 [Terfezia boudieri ATCC MYA-4762]